MSDPSPTTYDAARTQAILQRLANGEAEALLREDPEGIKRAAAEGLAAINHPRPESHKERMARVRKLHPRAGEPWSEDEDAHLLRRFDEGAKVSDLSKEMLRPQNAIRVRLEKWLGPSWRGRGSSE